MHRICIVSSMRTTLDLNKSLIEEALRLTGTKTKKAVIEAGLRELIHAEKVNLFINARGSISDLIITADDVRRWRDQEESIIEIASVNEPSNT